MTIAFRCDLCGAALADDDPNRYVVRIEVFAAADRIALKLPEDKDLGTAIGELVRELNRADPDVIEDRTYRNFRFDLCLHCHRRFLTHPLPAPRDT